MFFRGLLQLTNIFQHVRCRRNYFEIISLKLWLNKTLKLFQLLKLFQNNFRGLLQLTNIFQHVQCRRNYFEIISDVVTCEIKLFQRFVSHVTTSLPAHVPVNCRRQLHTFLANVSVAVIVS